MATTNTQGGTLAGTAGGTLLTIVTSLHMEEVMRTVILACLGAVVSFSFSLFMKWLVKRVRKSS